MGLILSINIHATDKAECEKLFTSATYNFYLENACKYEKNVSVPITKVFEGKNCLEVFTQEDMKRVTNDVLGKSYNTMNKEGRESFCQSNKAKYAELLKVYINNTY